MLTKLQGVVLHSFKYGDSGRVVKVYTKEKGLLAFLIRSTYSKKKGSSSALFQPLTALDIEANVKSTKGLQYIKEASLRSGLQTTGSNPYRSAISLFMAEVFLHSIQEDEPNVELYAFLIEWIDRLHSSERLALFPVSFLLQLTRPLGFYPELDERGGYFDLREGVVLADPPGHADFISKGITKSLRELHGMDIVAPIKQEMTRERRRELLHALLLYFRIHILYFKPINSHTVLEETFGR